MVRVNLLPIRDILRKRELKHFGMTAAAIAGVFILFAGFTYWFLGSSISKLEDKKSAHQRKLDDLKKKNQEINRLKSELAHLHNQVRTIENLTQRRDTPAPFMRALSMAMPDSVWVTFISKAGRRFSISGNGLDNKEVVDFVQNLQRVRKNPTLSEPWVDPDSKEDSPFFAGVKLEQIVRAGRAGGMMQFKISGHISN